MTYTKVMPIRLSGDELERVERFAEEHGLTRSAVIRAACQLTLKNPKNRAILRRVAKRERPRPPRGD